MTATGINLFNTALGFCGLAWTERGIAGVQLPERDQMATLVRLQERFPDFDESPIRGNVRTAREGIIALLDGRSQDFADVVLDIRAIAPFRYRVYNAARTIPCGETLTYGELATRIGAPGSARAVGQALGRNPFPIIVPCHRVLASGGKTGGFTAEGGISTKLRMLALEGVNLVNPNLLAPTTANKKFSVTIALERAKLAI